MKWQEHMRDFMFYWYIECRDAVDLDLEAENFSRDSLEFDNINFEKWLKNNNYEEEYESFTARFITEF